MPSRFVLIRSAVLTVAAASAAPARARADDAAIRLATVAIDSGAEPYYARELGFFANAGLSVDVQTASQGAAIAAGVAAGSLEIGFANVAAIAAAFAEGVPIAVIAPAGLYLSSRPTTVCLVPKDSRVRTAADLTGKTLATGVLRGIGEFGPRAWIDKNGGDSSTVKFVEMPYPAMADALARDRVDGVVTVEPLVAAAEAVGRVLAYCYDGIAKRFLIGAFFATPAWANAHRDAVHRFQAVMRATARWANRNQERTLAMYGRQAKLDLTNVRAIVRSPYAESLDPHDMQPLIDVAAHYGAIKATFPAGDLIWR